MKVEIRIPKMKSVKVEWKGILRKKIIVEVEKEDQKD